MKGINLNASSSWLQAPKTPNWLKSHKQQQQEQKEMKEMLATIDNKIERLHKYLGIEK